MSRTIDMEYDDASLVRRYGDVEMTETIEAEARLRAKNQLTVPGAIVEVLEARQDDLLVFEADAREPGTAVVRVVPRTFAGALTGVYGTTEEVKAFLREEHAAWDR